MGGVGCVGGWAGEVVVGEWTVAGLRITGVCLFEGIWEEAREACCAEPLLRRGSDTVLCCWPRYLYKRRLACTFREHWLFWIFRDLSWSLLFLGVLACRCSCYDDDGCGVSAGYQPRGRRVTRLFIWQGPAWIVNISDRTRVTFHLGPVSSSRHVLMAASFALGLAEVLSILDGGLDLVNHILPRRKRTASRPRYETPASPDARMTTDGVDKD